MKDYKSMSFSELKEYGLEPVKSAGPYKHWIWKVKKWHPRVTSFSNKKYTDSVVFHWEYRRLTQDQLWEWKVEDL